MALQYEELMEMLEGQLPPRTVYSPAKGKKKLAEEKKKKDAKFPHRLHSASENNFTKGKRDGRQNF